MPAPPQIRPGPRVRRWPPFSAQVYRTAIGGLPPAVTVIPWTWFASDQLAIRVNQPINSMQVTGTSNILSVSNNATSQSAYGVFAASSTLDTDVVADAAVFATFITTFYANPVASAPTLTLDLVPRTDAERLLILGMEIGMRFTFGPGTGTDGMGGTIPIPVPGGLPPAVLSMVIEGVAHSSSVNVRTVTWNTTGLIGTTQGSAGPWFRLDSSTLDGTDIVPF